MRLLRVTAVALFFLTPAHGRWGGLGRSDDEGSFLPRLDGVDPLDDADAAKLMAHFEPLITRFAPELVEQFRESEIFSKLTKASPHKCKGQIGRVEASMLYVALRVQQPERVLEVGTLCGSSARWILAALEKNEAGRLYTNDLFDIAPKFVPQTVPTDRWTFVKGDVLEAAARDPSVAEADFLFIDAYHRNAFAREYEKALLARSRAKRVPVFVHDIFSPFMIPLYKPCQRAMTLETLDEERACIKERADAFAKRHGADTFYGPTQPGGEGLELMSWLARTGRSRGVVTFSPYAAPQFARLVLAAFKRNSLNVSQINSPAVFFELHP